MKIGFFGKALCATALSATMVNAQDMNLYKSLNLSLEDPTLGSARYAGMGGAMGAIGGVSSALKDNAASIAAGTRSDIGLTFDLYSNNDGRCTFAVSDASLLFNIDHNNSGGYMSSALAITYNRNRTFDSDMYRECKFIGENGKDQSTINDHEEGGTDAINFAYAGNINNQFFFGVAVGITNLRFNKRNFYVDSYLNDDFLSESDGSGCNFNVGLLYQPTDAFRVGVGVQTPTLYNMEESWSLFEGDRETFDSYRYKLHTPMKASFQLGFMLGDRANIGLDYSMRNYSRMWEEVENVKMRKIEKNVKEVGKIQHTIKLGAEINVIDGLDLRAGYAICTAPVMEATEACSALKAQGGAYSGDYWIERQNEYGEQIEEFYGPLYSFTSPKMRQYISAGFGYSGRIAYIDFAYIRKLSTEQFMLNSPFNEYQCDLVSEYAAKEEYRFGSNHFMLSFGFRF